MVNLIRAAMNERDKGFTLVELLVVIIVIGILAVIAIPLFLNQRKKAVDASIKSDVRNGALLVETYATNNAAATTVAIGDLYALGFKVSPANIVEVTGSPTSGYCVLGWNVEGSDTHNSRASALRYDSLAGGLDTYGGACTKPRKPTKPVGTPECGYGTEGVLVTCSSYGNQSYINANGFDKPVPPGGGQPGGPFYRFGWFSGSDCTGSSLTGDSISASASWQPEPSTWTMCQTNEVYCCSFTWFPAGPTITLPGSNGSKAVKP